MATKLAGSVLSRRHLSSNVIAKALMNNTLVPARFPMFDMSVVHPGAPRHPHRPSAKEYHLDASLPGVPRDHVKVTLDEKHRMLTLSCTRESSVPDDFKVASVVFHKQERGTGTAVRSVKLPSDADLDAIKCTFKEGVLRIAAPRSNNMKEGKINIEIGA